MNLDDIFNGSRAFVDANVILYALDHKSPSCRHFLSRCDGKAVDGTISTVTLAEVAHRSLQAPNRKSTRMDANAVNAPGMHSLVPFSFTCIGVHSRLS